MKDRDRMCLLTRTVNNSRFEAELSDRYFWHIDESICVCLVVKGRQTPVDKCTTYWRSMSPMAKLQYSKCSRIWSLDWMLLERLVLLFVSCNSAEWVSVTYFLGEIRELDRQKSVGFWSRLGGWWWWTKVPCSEDTRSKVAIGAVEKGSCVLLDLLKPLHSRLWTQWLDVACLRHLCCLKEYDGTGASWLSNWRCFSVPFT